MIQRKQTLFLLLSIFASGALFFYLSETKILGMAINACAALLAFVAIFIYKKRALQVKLCYALMLLQLTITLLVSFSSISSNSELASIIGVVGMMSAYFAAYFIKKDIELLKSADRIR